MSRKFRIALIVTLLVTFFIHSCDNDFIHVNTAYELLGITRNPTEVLKDLNILNDNLLNIDRSSTQVCSDEVEKYRPEFVKLRAEIYRYPVQFVGLSSLTILSVNLGSCMVCDIDSRDAVNSCYNIKREIPLIEEDLRRN